MTTTQYMTVNNSRQTTVLLRGRNNAPASSWPLIGSLCLSVRRCYKRSGCKSSSFFIHGSRRCLSVSQIDVALDETWCDTRRTAFATVGGRVSTVAKSDVRGRSSSTTLRPSSRRHRLPSARPLLLLVCNCKEAGIRVYRNLSKYNKKA